MKPPDREVTKPLINWPDYEVTTLGRIWSIKRKKFLKPLSMNGYSAVKLYCMKTSRTLMVSALVLEAFVGPRPKGYKVKYLNGEKADNRLVNIEWQKRSTEVKPTTAEDREAAYDAFSHAGHKPGGVTKQWPYKEICRCFRSVKSVKQAKQLLQDFYEEHGTELEN